MEGARGLQIRCMTLAGWCSVLLRMIDLFSSALDMAGHGRCVSWQAVSVH